MDNTESDAGSPGESPEPADRSRVVADGERRDSPSRNGGQQRDRQPSQRQQPREQQPPQGQPPAQGPGGRPPSQGGSGSGGFSRRQLLLGGGGVAVAGWFFFFRSDSDDGSTGDSGPDPTRSATSVVEAYYNRAKNENFSGAKDLFHPDRSPPSDDQLEQLADTLSSATAIEAEVTNGPTPDADRSRYDTVQQFESILATIEQEDGGTNYVSGTVAHHTDGRWLIWL